MMYNGIRTVGMWSALYFIALMTIGYYVLFNLLVAILVEGFTCSGPKKGEKKETSKSPEIIHEKTLENTASDNCCSGLECLIETGNSRLCPGNEFCQPIEYCGHGVRKAFNGPFQIKSKSFYGQEKNMIVEEHVSGKQSVDYPLTMPELKKMRQTNISIVQRTRMAGKPERQNEKCNRNISSSSNVVPDCRTGLRVETKYNPAYEPDDDDTFTSTPTTQTEKSLDKNVKNRKCESNKTTVQQKLYSKEIKILNGKANNSGSKKQFPFPDCLRSTKLHKSNENTSSFEIKESSILQQIPTQQNHQESSGNEMRIISFRRQDWSLFIFPPNNRLRVCLATICSNKWFDYTVLFFILLSCVFLSMEEPSETASSKGKRKLIDTSMFVFTIIFTLEMMMKVVANGFVIGPRTYLRDGWNILDGSLVLLSWIDVVVTHTPLNAPGVVGTLRVLRAFRTLRPLRVIRRAPGLKLVVETLLYSLKPIGNTVLIAAIFFLIFGILGVQLFKGTFYYCDGNNQVVDRSECNNSTRGHWVNQLYNFDNLPQALITLFVFSTKDGWVEIMINGIDAVGVDKQPVVNYAEWRLLYFVPFLLLGGFLVLNMIVGVVVENFQQARQRQAKEDSSKKRKERQKKSKQGAKKGEDAKYFESYSPWRRLVYGVCAHPYWDMGIAVIICINVICMSLEHYNMSKFYKVFVETSNLFFTAVFVIEVTIRLIAAGCSRYFKDRWNLVDLLIVALSVTGILLQVANTHDLKVNPSIIRALRVLRIVRVLKLVKLAKGVRSLLDTILEALPQVGNLGLLFLLLFFIYSCLGIQLFGTLECSRDYPCLGMGRHAHFRDFGTAMLTLFRIATGDNWNGIFKDTLRKKCSSSSNCTKNCCVSKYSAPLFFITFVLLAQFVLVNVVIAVLMKHLKESKEKIAANIAARHLERKLRLVTLAARRFIQSRARRNPGEITSRRSIVEIGLSGIELAQLKKHKKLNDKSFYMELLKSDALFQDFLNLKSSLQNAKRRACRTSSHNKMESFNNKKQEIALKRRHTIAAIQR